MRIHGFKSKNTLEELDIAAEQMENPYSFEDYCGVCDNFNTDFCPFKDKVDIATKWKQINCNDFFS